MGGVLPHSMCAFVRHYVRFCPALCTISPPYLILNRFSKTEHELLGGRYEKKVTGGLEELKQQDRCSMTL